MVTEGSAPLSYQRFFEVVRQANTIAAISDFETLLERTLDLFVEVVSAAAGTLYLYDAERDALVFKVVKGDPASRSLLGTSMPASRGIVGAALRGGAPIFINDVEHDSRWERSMQELSGLRLRSAYCLPLISENRPVGVVQVFNIAPTAIDDEEERALLQLLANAMVGAIEKARLLEAAQQRERRLGALVDTIARLGHTLDRNELLTRIMDHARELLEVEATSVWELDERQGVLVLHAATGAGSARLKQVTVPLGQGFIGRCVATGQRVLVQDVSSERAQHYAEIDQRSGFVSRAILTVPLRAPRIQLGRDRGALKESIIGGAQALNKRNGEPFNDDDIELFETFAGQAATVLQLSRLYDEANRLFLGVIKVVAGAIDAKDPYTQGHSQRVAEFAVAIAEELGLSQEEIYHVKIAGILHDVGKIGVPDAILQKPGLLTDEERAEIYKHPERGYEIMCQEELVWLLREELPALLEHHERLDGKGYPRQLSGAQISLIGRIIAVADTFDALTSDRPYRAGSPPEQALATLQREAGQLLDAACVAALQRARARGKVMTQSERRGYAE